MITSTANVNSSLNEIVNAIEKAENKGLAVGFAHHGSIFCCIALSASINQTIDLSAKNASLKLSALIQLINVKAKQAQGVK